MDQNHDTDLNSGITIRAAKQTLREGLVFAQLYNETAEGFFKSMLGRRAFEIIAESYRLPNNEYSYENVAFAEYQNQIVGMVSAYTMSEKLGFSKKSLKSRSRGIPLRIMIFSAVGRILSRQLGPKGKGDFYLQAIIVDGRIRGKGIGRSLFSYIEKLAVEKGAERLSLDVSSKNDKAISLYKRQGMVVDSVWPSVPFLPPVFIRMTKIFTDVDRWQGLSE